MPSRLRWSLLVGFEALLIVLLLPFGFIYTGSLPVHLFQYLVIGAAGAVGWIAVVWRPSACPPILVLAPFPLLAAVFVTAFVSPYPSLSWPAAWQTAAYAGVFWLLVLQAGHPVGRRNLVAVIGIVVSLALASFFVAVLMDWREWLSLGFPLASLPLRPSNTGGLAGVPTWFADLVVLGTPVLVVALWQRSARLPAVAIAAATGVAIALSGTRSVLLLLVLASVITILLVVGRRAERRTVSMAVGGLIVIGVLGLAVAIGSSRSFDEGRSSAFASAFAQMSRSPIAGSGPGAYGVRRLSDAVDDLGQLVFPEAHDIILNTGAESGIVGLIGLAGTVALVVLAILRSWRLSPRDRPIIGGAIFGLAVFFGHGMVDVVFGLVGIVVMVLGVSAIATTSATEQTEAVMPGARSVRMGLGVAMLVVVLSTVAVVRTESTRLAVGAADAMLARDPGGAETLAHGASSANPDLVPAWWVEMAAADADGNTTGAIEAARKIVELEGFGQQWISLAVLAARSGDQALAGEALARARAGPPEDPIVELNAAELLLAAGDEPGATTAARRLLALQPDIEPALITGLPEVGRLVAAVRTEVAEQAFAAGDTSTSMQIALSGEDRALAMRLSDSLEAQDPAAADYWSSLVEAWFGNESARAAFEAAVRASPTAGGTVWAWRLAARACDRAAADDWERAAQVGFSITPVMAVEAGVAPGLQTRVLPLRYPAFLWRLEDPYRPYVGGTASFLEGPPACVVAGD